MNVRSSCFVLAEVCLPILVKNGSVVCVRVTTGKSMLGDSSEFRSVHRGLKSQPQISPLP